MSESDERKIDSEISKERHMRMIDHELQERDSFVDKCNRIIEKVNRDQGPFQMTLKEFIPMGSFEGMELLNLADYLSQRAHLPDLKFSESVYGLD